MMGGEHDGRARRVGEGKGRSVIIGENASRRYYIIIFFTATQSGRGYMYGMP
jgi:hypothetical protein